MRRESATNPPRNGREATASPRTMTTMQRGGRTLAIVAGLVVGAALGAWYRFQGSVPQTGFLAAGAFVIVIAVLVVGALLLGALLLSLSSRTKQLARSVATLAAAAAVGLPLGYLAGPTSTSPQALTGTLQIEFTKGVASSPLETVGMSADASCTTVRDGATVMEIAAGDFAVNGQAFSVTISWLDPTAPEVLLNLQLAGGDDLSGLLVSVNVGENRRTGTAGFGNLTVDDLDPDPPGDWDNPVGTVSWSCG